MVRVLLAVTHLGLRAALKEDVLPPGDFICGEAAHAEELWDQLAKHEWHVLVLDVCLPDHTKLQTLRTVHRRYPTLPILPIAISASITEKHWRDAGASGFVSKVSLNADLDEAVRVLSRGGTYFSDAGRRETRL